MAQLFETQWNFPNCLGALDGKHIVVRQPRNSGSYFFNYKGTFSLVLLALVDANYQFIYIDVGCNGRISDGGVFRNCSLATSLENNILNIPGDRKNVEQMQALPFVIVADDAFPLRNDLMKPYPLRNLSKEKRAFNYRLSRARRVVENAFGILANRFRVFLSPMLLSPENVEKVVLASCALHNFLREKSPLRYTPPEIFDGEDQETGRIIPGSWRSNGENKVFHSVNFSGSNNYNRQSKDIRDRFCEYFITDGKVPWQDKFS